MLCKYYDVPRNCIRLLFLSVPPLSFSIDAVSAYAVCLATGLSSTACYSILPPELFQIERHFSANRDALSRSATKLLATSLDFGGPQFHDSVDDVNR